MKFPTTWATHPSDHDIFHHTSKEKYYAPTSRTLSSRLGELSYALTRNFDRIDNVESDFVDYFFDHLLGFVPHFQSQTFRNSNFPCSHDCHRDDVRGASYHSFSNCVNIF